MDERTIRVPERHADHFEARVAELTSKACMVRGPSVPPPTVEAPAPGLQASRPGPEEIRRERERKMRLPEHGGFGMMADPYGLLTGVKGQAYAAEHHGALLASRSKLTGGHITPAQHAEAVAELLASDPSPPDRGWYRRGGALTFDK